jgi:Tfp pilus assembly protein PilO
MSEARSGLIPFWKQRRFYLPILVGVAINGLVYLALTYRLATKQERLARQHTVLIDDVAGKQQTLADLEIESERLSRNEETVQRFWSEIVQPKEPGLTEAWAELDRLAQDSGLDMGRKSFRYEPLDVGLTRVNASMPLEGDYFDLVSFINRLETSPRFFLVREISLSRGRGNESQIGLNCDVSFYIKDDEGEGNEETS